MNARSLTRSTTGLAATLLVLALMGAVLVARSGPSAAPDAASAASDAVDPVACPPGTRPLSEHREGRIDQAAADPLYGGGRGASPAELGYGLYSDCRPVNGPESFQELALRDAQQAGIRSAPFETVSGQAMMAAVAQREALLNADVAGAGGTMTKYGTGPLRFQDPRFSQVNGQGIVDSTGRVDGFHYDEGTGYLFAAIGTGGIWLSEDLGENWRPISNSLPTQVVGDVSYSPAGGPQGTVVVVTGEHTFGGGSYTGLGVYYSRDLGLTWARADGPPAGALGFAIEVDPSNPNIVYAATGNGLWRSTDAGVSYVDVVLPTGPCAGDYNDTTCNFANFVTDVVVQAPGGQPEVAGGAVVAAVGWRAGRATSPDGTIQSEGNGIYRSDTGAPGTFSYLPGLGDAAGGQERLARTEFGPATGPEQDHNYLYAVVEDAVLFNGGSPILDGSFEDGGLGKLISGTVLNGIYVSADFGATWTLLADDHEIATSCPTNQSVYCVPGLGVTPGVQSWYNMWIAPDPTRQTGGAPTRVLFGLEEVWQSETTSGVPATTTATGFQVIGSYYGELGCLVGACVIGTVTDVVATTHPDQHAGIMIPLDNGGVKLVVGHDGGVSTQTVDPLGPSLDTEFTQLTWELAQENGLQTLLPYSAVWANDGVAYAGLQDNGHMRVAPEQLGGAPTEDGSLNQFATYGADGTFAAVDPGNSDYVIESTQNAGMNVSIDGGETWSAMGMPASNIRFVNPFVMDPLDPNHVVSGGQQIVETLVGPDTGGADWIQVFDLGVAETEPVIDTGSPGTSPAYQQTALDTRGDTTYVGFCGVCDVLNSAYPFQNGLATNVNGDEDPEKGTTKGWHVATADGLPNRFITSVAIDPLDASQRTVYVTLGGYGRSWAPPGTAGNVTDDVGEGHVFKSTDAGETFVDISGDLPDTPALWVEPRGRQLLVGTDVGAFISSDTSTSPAWAVLGGGQLPSVPVTSIQLKADDPDKALLGTYGRGLWMYEFPDGQIATNIRRIFGPTRIETAVAVSEVSRAQADTVAIARADVYADALAGVPLAHRENAPMLLSHTDALPADVADEIRRLGATRAVVLGGEAALGAAVVTGLRAAGITDVDRVGGVDRFETAALVAARIGGTDVWITEGIDPDPARGWPDAMSIAPVAAVQQRPILLTATDRLPQATKDALADLGTRGARIVGGTTAVSAQVESELAGMVKVGDRLAGRDRYETSVLAAEAGIAAGLRDHSIWLARGGAFPDALAAGPAVAADGGLLALVHDTDLGASAVTRDFVAAHACNVLDLRLLGGVEAIAPAVEAGVRAIFDGLTCTDGPFAAGPVPAPPTPDPKGSGVPAAKPDTAAAGPFGWEADAEGWTASSADPYSAWVRGGPGHASETAFRISTYADLADATLTSPTIEGAGGEALLHYWAAFNVEGGGFDELQVGVLEDGAFQPYQTLGGISTGYPEFAEQELRFTEPSGPYQIRFHFYADEICSALVWLPVLCAGEGAYGDVAVDDVTLLR